MQILIIKKVSIKNWEMYAFVFILLQKATLHCFRTKGTSFVLINNSIVSKKSS